MEIRLEGTGGPEGWPVPGCPCASCGRLTPGHRRPASIVIDGRVRLTATAAGPAAVTAAGPTTSAGTAGSTSCGTAGAASVDVPGHPHGPGDHVPDGYVIRRTADGCEVTGPDGGSLLYAVGPVTGFSEPDDGRPFDVVLMDLPDRPERLGDLRRRGRITSTTRIIAVHLDHRALSEAELARRLTFWGAAAAADGTVMETAASKRPGSEEPGSQTTDSRGPGSQKPGSERASLEGASPQAADSERPTSKIPGPQAANAQRSGSEEASPQTTDSEWPGSQGPVPLAANREAADGEAARQVRARRTLLLGGSRSGKSEEAELRLAAEPEVTYVATGPSGGDDPAWLARVRAHRERRPAHWRTVETTDLEAVLSGEPGTFLIDGIGTWLAAVFDECAAWPDDTRGDDHRAALDRVTRRCDALVAAWRGTRSRVVAVSDEVGLGVIPSTPAGRLFRDALGRLNQALARESEDVALVVAGRVVPLPL